MKASCTRHGKAAKARTLRQASAPRAVTALLAVAPTMPAAAPNWRPTRQPTQTATSFSTTNWPRRAWGAISQMYAGATRKASPVPMPRTKRPSRKAAAVVDDHSIATATTMSESTRARAQRRPHRSATQASPILASSEPAAAMDITACFSAQLETRCASRPRGQSSRSRTMSSSSVLVTQMSYPFVSPQRTLKRRQASCTASGRCQGLRRPGAGRARRAWAAASASSSS
mmetsp:Transcript_2954/g.8703  ORF Transcript_2954/g.8703 Transcript_2954/m.8703 type:complete len:229 (+) Transcript_2954:410-1096(+)